MSAKEYLQKYPEVERLLEKVVRQAKLENLNYEQGIQRFIQKMKKRFRVAVPYETAFELWIA